jgi:hypothetical protein
MKLAPITGIADLSVGDIITSLPSGGYYDWMITSIEGDSISTVHRIRGKSEEFSECSMSWNVSSWTRGTSGKYLPEFLKYDPKQAGDTDDDI